MVFRNSSATKAMILINRARTGQRSNLSCEVRSAAQTDYPTRPQPKKTPAAYPRGYVEDVFRGENAVESLFQQPKLEEGHAGIRNRRIILIGDAAVVA